MNQEIKKYKVTTETRGVLYFAELPINTYFLEGVREISDAGKATFRRGASLIPICYTETGKQVQDITRAGKTITRDGDSI